MLKAIINIFSEDDNPQETTLEKINELKLEKNEITLDESKSASIKITDGNGTYKLIVNNDNVTATEKDNIINIVAVNAGTSEITITMKKKKYYNGRNL